MATEIFSGREIISAPIIVMAVLQAETDLMVRAVLIQAVPKKATAVLLKTETVRTRPDIRAKAKNIWI